MGTHQAVPGSGNAKFESGNCLSRASQVEQVQFDIGLDCLMAMTRGSAEEPRLRLQ